MKSVDELFENIWKQKTPGLFLEQDEEVQDQEQQEADVSRSSKPPKKSKELPSKVEYDEIIAKHLGDAAPQGTYEIGKSFKIQNTEDLKNFQKLFPITAPKVGKSIDEPGTKGSGNGEVALYWLFKKEYPSIKDNREGAKPDLSVIINGNEVGIEVKSYEGAKEISIGRFGDQVHNRNLLSVILGLNALFGSSQKKRTPSLDTWNKNEIIEACKQLVKLNDNESLRDLVGDFDLIRDVYEKVDSTIDELKEELDSADNFTAEDLAASMLLKILKFKLETKPGWGGFFANVTYSGDVKFISVGEAPTLRDLDSKVVLDSIKANGAALKANVQYIYSSSKR